MGQNYPSLSLSKLSNFFYALEENLDMSDSKTQTSQTTGSKFPLLSKLSNFLAFPKKQNYALSFYFQIDLLLIAVADIDLGQV